VNWCRLYADTPGNLTLRLVAKRTGLPVVVVVGVWTAMLCHATAADPRGTLAGWSDEIMAVGLDMEPGTIAAIRAAMQGLLLEEDRLTGWAKRQFLSDSSTTRTRAWRQKHGSADAGRRAPPGGNVTAPSRGVPVTPCDAPDQNRTDSPPPSEAPKGEDKKAELFGDGLAALMRLTRSKDSTCRKHLGRWLKLTRD
jgi:hypothetical protein